MSLLKRVIKSFRKLFQIKKSPLKKKIKPRRKQTGSRKISVKSNFKRKSNAAHHSSHKKASKKSAPQAKAVRISLEKIKTASKQPLAKHNTKASPPQIDAPKGKYIGGITHYFARIKVVVLEIKNGPLKTGDRILIQGTKSNFSQTVRSMQIESVEVKSAKKGQIIGLQVVQDAQVGDKVFLHK